MLILHLILGLLLVCLVFLSWWMNPYMMLGYYSSIPKEKKENVDFDGLFAFTKKGFIIISITVMVSPFIMQIFHLEVYTLLLMIFEIMIGTMIIFLIGQKYDHNAKGKSVYRLIFFVLITLFSTGTVAHSFIPPKTIFKEEIIQFKGSFGFKINISDIGSVELVDTIPNNKRIYGVGAGYLKKGRFRVESWGECRLLVHSKKSPFLIITKNDDEKFIINYYKPSETENTYKQIELLKDK